MQQRPHWKKSQHQNNEIADETESHNSLQPSDNSSLKSKGKAGKSEDLKYLFDKQESLHKNLEKHKMQSAHQTQQILARLDNFQSEIQQSLSRLSRKSCLEKSDQQSNYNSYVLDPRDKEQAYLQNLYKSQPQKQEVRIFTKQQEFARPQQTTPYYLNHTVTSVKPIEQQKLAPQTSPFEMSEKNKFSQQTAQFNQHGNYLAKQSSQPQIFQADRKVLTDSSYLQGQNQRKVIFQNQFESPSTAAGSVQVYERQKYQQDNSQYDQQQQELYRQSEQRKLQQQQELQLKYKQEQELFLKQQQEQLLRQQEYEKQKERERQQLLLMKQAEIERKEQELEQQFQMSQQELLQQKQFRLQELRSQKMEFEQYQPNLQVYQTNLIQSPEFNEVTIGKGKKGEIFEVKQLGPSMKVTTFVYDKGRLETLKKLYYVEYRKAKSQFEENAKLRFEDLTGRGQFEVEDTYCKDCKKFFNVEEINSHNCKQRQTQAEQSCYLRWYQNGKKFVKDKIDEWFPREILRKLTKSCNEEIYEILYGSLPKAIYLLKIETLNNSKLKNDFYLGHAIGQAILNCDKAQKLKEHYRNLEFMIQSAEPMSGLNEHKVIFVLHILFERAMFKVELYEKQEK